MTTPSRDEARERLASCADYPESRRSDGVLLTTVRVDDLRALLSPEGQGAPVAWRVKDFADGWILFNSEAAAAALRQKETSDEALRKLHPLS